MSYCQGSLRLLFGGTSGEEPSFATSSRVSSPSQARSIATASAVNGVSDSSLRPSGASPACPGDRRKLTAVRSFAAIMWIFVVHPPRDLPMLCAPFF